MTPNFNNPVQWGQSKKILPADWQQNTPIPLVNLDRVLVPHPAGEHVIHTHIGALRAQQRVPKVQNISLSMTGYPGGQNIVRWRLAYGCGGAADTVDLDANGTQQLSLSADWLRISLVSTSPGVHSGVGWTRPTNELDVAAFFADGMTATDAPTYTEFFTVPPNSSITVTPPNGATGFRVLGDPTNLSVFAATVSYQIVYVGGVLVTDNYAGDYIEGVRLAPIPITGGSEQLIITNGNLATDIAGGLAWDLDF